jgi:hypothetical protein
MGFLLSNKDYKIFHIYHTFMLLVKYVNRIGGVMVSVLASSVVDRGFEPGSGQTKDYKIGICCFSANHKEKEHILVGSE